MYGRGVMTMDDELDAGLTSGSVVGALVRFSLPYLLSCFLQTFYGLVDMFITGAYNGAASITAVAVGSQVMHMITLVIVGLAMGPTVLIGRAVGAGDRRSVEICVGASVTLFAMLAAAATFALLVSTEGVLRILSVPPEALEETRRYLLICFVGVPFITAYNLLCAIFRGMGDSKRPMWFVAAAGVFNIFLDWLLIGPFGMGAAGAAAGTVVSQAASVVIALVAIRRMSLGIRPSARDLKPDRGSLSSMMKIGLPVAVQELFIQLSFIIITIIANGRGVEIAAAVGIVEKIIGFLFLVPSAMLSSVSTVASQNAGAGLHERGRVALTWGCGITVAAGCVFTLICEVYAEPIIALFAGSEPGVIAMGAQYIRTYVFDCAIAGVHFCYSGYFCAYGMSMIPFAHNLASSLLVRIPGAYLASVLFTSSLWPMGLAAPAGSVLSVVICVAAYRYFERKGRLA